MSASSKFQALIWIALPWLLRSIYFIVLKKAMYLYVVKCTNWDVFQLLTLMVEEKTDSKYKKAKVIKKYVFLKYGLLLLAVNSLLAFCFEDNWIMYFPKPVRYLPWQIAVFRWDTGVNMCKLYFLQGLHMRKQSLPENYINRHEKYIILDMAFLKQSSLVKTSSLLRIISVLSG